MEQKAQLTSFHTAVEVDGAKAVREESTGSQNAAENKSDQLGLSQAHSACVQ